MPSRVLKKLSKGGSVRKGLHLYSADREARKAMRAALLTERAMQQRNDGGSGFGSTIGALNAASKRATGESAMDRVEVTGGTAVAVSSALLGAVCAEGTAADIGARVAEGRREVAACGQAAACDQDCATFVALAAEGAPLLAEMRARTATYLATSADKPAKFHGKKKKKADGSFVTKDEQRASSRKSNAAYHERGGRGVADGDEAENVRQMEGEIQRQARKNRRKEIKKREERRGMPPSAVGAPPRAAVHAALHRDVSYFQGSAPGNAEGNPVLYRARIRKGTYKGKFAINRDAGSIYHNKQVFETEAAAIAALPAAQRRA